MLLVTYQGKVIRFSEKEVKTSQRDTKGVKGIALRAGDYVVGAETISAPTTTEAGAKDQPTLLVVTKRGLGKRTQLDQYPKQKRSGLGVKVAEINTKTGPLAGAILTTTEHKDVVITTKEGQTIKLPLTKKAIPILTRPTQGVILIRLKPNDEVAAVALTFKQVEDNDGQEGGGEKS